METAKKVTNERSGREGEKPSVACTVMDVSAKKQFSEGSAPRKTEEISRLQLQSSSTRTEATVAAVAAAGAEAAWRDLDRVRGLCWQTTDRGLQRRAATFEGKAEALSSGENARPGGIGQSEARRCLLVAMGLAFTIIWERLVGKTDAENLMVQLEAAGQTTILCELKIGKMVTTITKIGRIVETVEYKNLCFATRSAGGQDKIQPRRRQYYWRLYGLVYAVVFHTCGHSLTSVSVCTR